MASAGLRSTNGGAGTHRPRARRVLFHRLDHCNQSGAQGKSGERDCAHVHRSDCGAGDGGAARHFHPGQGFGWQTTFLAVSFLGMVAFIGGMVLVPNKLKQQQPPASLLTQLAVIRKPRLLLVYAMTALGYGGSFVAFTYLAPILEQVTGFASSRVGLVMLVYGVSVAIGIISGAGNSPGPERADPRIAESSLPCLRWSCWCSNSPRRRRCWSC